MIGRWRTRPVELPALPPKQPGQPDDVAALRARLTAVQEALYAARADIAAARAAQRDVAARCGRLIVELTGRDSRITELQRELAQLGEELAAERAEPRPAVVVEEPDLAAWRCRALRAEDTLRQYDRQRLPRVHHGGAVLARWAADTAKQAAWEEGYRTGAEMSHSLGCDAMAAECDQLREQLGELLAKTEGAPA